MKDAEVLIRGTEELTREKQVVEETVEDIGDFLGETIEARQVKASDFEDKEDFNDIYHEIEGSRDFESEFDRKDGRVDGGSMTSVLILQPFRKEEFKNTPVMYVTDEPLYVEDWDTGETRDVIGVTQPSYHRPASVLSTADFQDMGQHLHDELLETLTYHEGGHLLGENDPDREYRDENEFGGGHCPEKDVMHGKTIWGDTRNRYDNEVYCEACTEEIRNGIERLWEE